MLIMTAVTAKQTLQNNFQPLKTMRRAQVGSYLQQRMRAGVYRLGFNNENKKHLKYILLPSNLDSYCSKHQLSLNNEVDVHADSFDNVMTKFVINKSRHKRTKRQKVKFASS